MNKNALIIGILIFVFVTVFALTLDNSSTKRVQISARDVAMNNDSSSTLGGKDVKVNLEQSNFTSTNINTENKDVNINTSSNINSSDVSFSGSDTGFSGQKSNINYKNVDMLEVDAALEAANNISTQKIETSLPPRRYMYKNIDWNTWKSNFVNQILEDSLNIHELDRYNEGDWLSYSFNVDVEGRISNIVVKSFALSQSDKDKVARIIKSYERTDITLFPPNTKKKTARVFAVMMLSDTTQKSNPNDFHDFERVKIQY